MSELDERVPEILDVAMLQHYYGLKRDTAMLLMQHLDKIRVPGVRKVWVKRTDLERLLDQHTVRA